MRFYDRQQELAALNTLMGQVNVRSRMAVLTGRRRVGKTLLSLEFAKDKKHLYLFVAKKSEALLCEEYVAEIKRLFPDNPVIGDIRSFSGVFQFLLQIARQESFTVIIDEFQEFYNINPSVYSEIQKLWDLNKSKSKLNVICVGSVYSLMHKIFEGSKEPLFNRADRILMIKPFSIRTMASILRDYKIKDPEVLFDYYLFTGGSPKYIDLLVENKAFTFEKILNFAVDANSPLLNEGRNLLIEEFGKEYGTYFSILELISVGKTGRSEIQSILESDVGGYLDRLEKDYAVIEKYKPINAKPNSKAQKYKISDNFLAFWFRFIYRNRSAVETGNFDYIKDMIRRDYSTYAGRVLEQFYRSLLAESGRYNRIGSYWEKDHQNEIDVVAVNDMKKELFIAEVKIKKAKVDLAGLKVKAKTLVASYPKYKVEWESLGLEDVPVAF
ncbi:MAG: ATP-binding protein [Candidatus Omnitrophica bacterium]|nr:ATP-binding protein [Candidatus Omnitrophota bacterium]